MAERNGDLIKWLIRALYGLIILWLINLTTNLICVDKDSRNRDTLEASQREYVGNEVTRINTNQVEVIKKVDRILDNQEKISDNQIIQGKILTRLETKIEKIQ